MVICLIISTILILIFAFINGFNDSCIVVAPLVSSRTTSIKIALLIASIGNFIGPLIFGTIVAKTIGEGLFNLGTFKIETILFALIAAIAWNIITWYSGIPSSSSHTLIGAIIGASIIFNGFSSIKLTGLYKILIFLLLSPLIGFIIGSIVTKVTYFTLRNAKPKINNFLRISQIPLSIVLSISHGANDSQKTTALMAMVFLISGIFNTFKIPYWMLIANAFAISLGSLIGGKRVIKTVGEKMFNIKPINSFSALLTSSSIIIASTLLGGPVSSTHILSSSLVGSGASERINKIRWSVIHKIIFVLFFTIPITAAISMVFSYLYKLVKG